jgi:hypothetical protein
VTVTVVAVNDAPVATNDIATTNTDTAVTMNPLANDTDVDGDTLTVTTATAINGAVIINADYSLTYTPNTDFNGNDSINYDITDGNGGSASAIVTVTVVAVSDAPVATNDPFSYAVLRRCSK